MIKTFKWSPWCFCVLVGLLGLFLLLALKYYGFTIDDTYISLVYVRNILEGKGLAFNGMRVEGYSNLLWILVVTGGCLLSGLAPIEVAKFLSLLFSALSMVSAQAILVVINRSRASTWVILWLALNLFYSVWSVGGLETTLYTCLIVAIVLVYVRFDGRAKWVTMGLLSGLIALTRPEGFAVVGMILTYYGVREQVWQNQNKWGPILLIFAGWAVIVFPFWTFRLIYYEHFWPATVYAKMGGLEQILDGLRYVRDFLGANWYWPLLALFGMRYVFRHHQETLHADAVILSVWLAGSIGAIVIVAGGDWMPAFRLLIPVLPLLYLVIAAEIDLLFDRKKCIWYLVGVLLWGSVTLATLITRVYHHQSIQHIVDIAPGLPRAGLWLAQNAKPDDVVAVVDAGAIPYYSRLPTIDMVGLNNYHIAKQPGGFMWKYDVEYVLAQKPTYIQMHIVPSVNGKGQVVVDFIGAFKLYYHPEFQRWYDPVSDVPWTQLYRRRETPRSQTFVDRFYVVQYAGYPIAIEGNPGAKISFGVQVTNKGSGVWTAGGGNSGFGWVRLGYQFVSEDGGFYPPEPIRVPLPGDLAPEESTMLSFMLHLPESPGIYQLKVDLVLEGMTWFANMGTAPLIVPLSVVSH